MPTIKQVIDKVNLSNSYPNAILYRWLGELDKRKYEYPEDADTELAKKNIELYTTYLEAMDAFYTGDLADYSVLAFKFQLIYEGEMR